MVGHDLCDTWLREEDDEFARSMRWPSSEDPLIGIRYDPEQGLKGSRRRGSQRPPQEKSHER
jgi:hypothetical protein